MVEVWLPYGDTEVPIMLPDPINLKIMPKTIYPSSKEQDSLGKFRTMVVKRTPLKVFLSPLADEAERGYIVGVLRRLAVDFEVVENFDESNIVVDIFRYDPILGFRSSLWVSNLIDDPLSFLRDAMYRELIPKIEVDEKLYVDLILDGGARLYDVLASRDGSHLREAREIYTRGWCLKTETAPLIISSLGGLPWDSSLYLFMIGLSKLDVLEVGDSTIIVISRTRVKDLDPTIFKDLTVDNAEDPFQLYIAYCRDKLAGYSIIHYGSIPRSIASLLNLSKTLSAEKYLSRIPITKKRDVLVIEDLYLLYPIKCVRSVSEEEA